MPTLRKVLNSMRFNYNRSFHRAGRHQVKRYASNRISRPPSQHPRRFISIGLTNRCQCRCNWCATGASPKQAKDELKTTEVERLLRHIAQSEFIFDNISFLGGECLLREDIYHLVRYATARGLFLHISTNGLLLDDERVARLLESGLNSVFVALSADPPENEQQRRHQDAVLQAVRACVSQDLPCFLSTCVCKENVLSGDLERIIRLGKELGAAGVRLMPVRLSGRWLWQSTDRVLDQGDEAKLRGLCRSGYAFLTDDCSEQMGLKCPAARGNLAYVSPYGDVHPCHFFPFSFGNVRDGDLDSILKRMWRHTMLQTESCACLLHDSVFRSQHITPLDPQIKLPVSVA